MPRLMRGAVLLSLVTGCPYDGRQNADGPTGPDGPPGDAADAPPGTPDGAPDARPLDQVAHIDADTEAMLTSTTPWVTAVPVDIDTTNGTITPNVPGGVIVLDDVAQDGGGPNVMVIQAGSIDIGATLVVRGSRPLILVADTISTTGLIDASAMGPEPGAGGFAPEEGPAAGIGAGVAGADGNNDSDSGGSGGSYGTAGGEGGAAQGAGATVAGATYGTAAVLIGGGGGGGGSPCATSGGGGGGAIQLTGKVSITLGNNINASGGGGQRGRSCPSSNGGSGAGGGAGGMIYLQAPAMLGAGNLGANGGGGGGGAADDGSTLGSVGGDGQSGSGGTAGAGSQDGGAGGAGASGNNTGANGDDSTGMNDNGGGGGGGVGHIYVNTTGPLPSYNFSPSAENG